MPDLRCDCCHTRLGVRWVDCFWMCPYCRREYLSRLVLEAFQLPRHLEAQR